MVRLDDAGIAAMRGVGRTAPTRSDQSGPFIAPIA